MVSKIDITYSEIVNFVDRYSTTAPEFDCIIGIARGGVVPATMLAYKLNIKNFYTIHLSSYDNNNKRGTIFEKVPLDVKNIINKRVLFVDDIADSGYTLEFVNKAYKRYTLLSEYFVCIEKLNTIFKPTYSGLLIDTKCWVNFPWEI